MDKDEHWKLRDLGGLCVRSTISPSLARELYSRASKTRRDFRPASFPRPDASGEPSFSYAVPLGPG